MQIITKRPEYPTAPPEFQDAVELWARKSGRHARLTFVPTEFQEGRTVNGTWLVRIDLRENDPRLSLYQDGKMPEKPTEDVWIHRSNPKEGKIKPNTHGRREQPFIPISIQQLGVSGLIGFLEKGDTWSGRGKYSSLEDQLQKVRKQNRERRHAFREQMKLENRMEQAQKRRQVLGIPLVPVGIDLKGTS